MLCYASSEGSEPGDRKGSPLHFSRQIKRNRALVYLTCIKTLPLLIPYFSFALNSITLFRFSCCFSLLFVLYSPHYMSPSRPNPAQSRERHAPSLAPPSIKPWNSTGQCSPAKEIGPQVLKSDNSSPDSYSRAGSARWQCRSQYPMRCGYR